jgi:hypothetical protein
MASTPSVELTSAYVTRARSPSRSYRGGLSDIVKHINRAGFHVATTHRITLPDGSTPHWHAKDLRIGDIVIWRGEG